MKPFLQALEDPNQIAQQVTHKSSYMCEVCTETLRLSGYQRSIYQNLIDTTKDFNENIVHTFDKRNWPEFENRLLSNIASDKIYNYGELKYILNKGTYYIPREDEFVMPNGVPVDFQDMRKTLSSKLRKQLWCGHETGKFYLDEDQEAYVLRATKAFLKRVDSEYPPALKLLNTLMEGDLKDV